MPMDICVQAMRRIGASNRVIGDIFRTWTIGNDPASGDIPATLDPGPPKVYTPDETVDRETRTFVFVFVTGVPTNDIATTQHWYLALEDPGTLDENGNPVKIKRHKGVLVLSDLPAPKTAELNQTNHTTVTWNTAKNALYIKLVEGGRRPMTNQDV